MKKQYGGLGVLDLRDMNTSPLLKWWWKYRDPTYNGIWKDIIQAKYSLNTPTSQLSSFWKEILIIKQIGELGIKFQIGDGLEV